MRNPIPITVVTGFLGAGKTTLLKNLLSQPHGLRIALILNELGQAGIDVGTPAETSMLELTEGCVCCLRNPDLLAALDELYERGDIDRIVIETTGLADPLALTWTLARQELREKVRLDAVVTAVDPGNFAAARSEEWEAQVRCADLIVLTKLDLADPKQVEEALAAVHEIQPPARILEGGVDLPVGIILDHHVESPRALGLPEVQKGRHSSFGIVSVGGPHKYRLDPLEDFLEDLPEAVFRGKGIVQIEDRSWAAFHVVGGRLQLDLNAPAPGHGESRIALFGKTLDRVFLEETLAACRIE